MAQDETPDGNKEILSAHLYLVPKPSGEWPTVGMHQITYIPNAQQTNDEHLVSGVWLHQYMCLAISNTNNSPALRHLQNTLDTVTLGRVRSHQTCAQHLSYLPPPIHPPRRIHLHSHISHPKWGATLCPGYNNIANRYTKCFVFTRHNTLFFVAMR